ncbi:hypothetical protein V6N13_030138 [Hibiscus sabdariffa]
MTVGDDTWEARDRSDGSREVQRFQRNSSTTTPLRINKGSMTKQGDGRKSLKPFVLVSLSRWPMKEGGGGVLIERCWGTRGCRRYTPWMVLGQWSELRGI